MLIVCVYLYLNVNSGGGRGICKSQRCACVRVMVGREEGGTLKC